MVLARLSARLLADGVPPSLLIDLFDPVGMQHALASELAEAQAGRTLSETAYVAPAQRSGVRSA